MEQYENLHYLVANLFDTSIGYSESQIKNELSAEADDTAFFFQTKAEILASEKDPNFSWLNLFDLYNAGYFESEQAAKEYAVKILAIFVQNST